MKKRILALMIAMLTLLSGCSLTSGIDTLLAPPKLSEEQEEIYSALLEFTGSKITLRYPKSGSYLSAFIVENIDSEPSDEAIVFYERSGAAVSDSSLRINVLDKIDGQWQSIYDMAGAGTDVEKVMVTKLGQSDITSVIVGYGLISESGKALKIYNYVDSILQSTYTDTYSLMDVVDADSDGTFELFVAAMDKSASSAIAKLVVTDSAETYYVNSYQLRANTSDFVQLQIGDISDSKPAFFIDTLNSNGLLQTEILCYRNGLLQSAYLTDENETDYVEMSVRSPGYLTTDIDGDLQYEIPILTDFPGYEDYSESEKVKMTLWTNYENGALKSKSPSYYNISGGYMFILPDGWLGNVTAKITGNEIIFCEFDRTANHEISDELSEILRISSAQNQNDADTLKSAGYSVIYEKGSNGCYVKYPSAVSEKYNVSATTLRSCFIIF
ncbi:MAG: hypothetical protein IJO29_07265 [Oscillospiraceae bacterium]|nr:hypothetical protein [Oscillospiraceae bacterium]